MRRFVIVLMLATTLLFATVATASAEGICVVGCIN